ncbi:MAG: penicillin-binding protein 1C [Deltaproteobacteria bacterium]|nr:penicillin-binding protein 1C [Deltaproteobacteria bacterium]
MALAGTPGMAVRIARASHCVRFAAGLLGLAAVVWLCLPRYPAERLSYASLRSTRLLDRDGVLLYERRGARGGYCRPVPLGAIAPAVVLATLSSEDAGFRRHLGVDPAGVLRALWLDARAGRFAYGGSTITQQLAKLLGPQPRTLRGKAREALDALRLERTLTKDEILEQYLNRAYYGRLAYGIEAAAERYFGKRASALSLDEAAFLAVLPRAPSAYDPERFPDRARQRRAHVLRHMARRGWIGQPEAEAAAATPIVLAQPAQEPRAPHVIDYVTSRELVPAGVPEQRLSIDLGLQEQLERQVRLHLGELAGRAAGQAGVVVLDNATGEVLAMVGSRRYDEAAACGAVNATTALRPPGSTLKPFVYALAIEDGAHPASLVLDVPTHWRGYQPREARQHYHGAVALRDALGSSLNVPAVRTAARVGPQRLAEVLYAAGLRSIDPARAYGLPLALGGASVPLVELANAYATLARGGSYLPYQLLHGGPTPAPVRVISAGSAFLVADSLADPAARRLEFGFETPLELPFPAAAKTGTSQAFGDNVAVGFTPAVTVAVWVGNFNGAPMHGLLAMQGAAPLWREVMLLAMRGRLAAHFQPPPGVARAEICADTGLLATPGCVRHRRDFVAERGPGSGPAAAGGGRPIEILGPPDGASFVLDPVLPRSRQKLELRATVRAAGARAVRWTVDGELVGEPGPPYVARWTLAPGPHHLRAEALGPEPAADEIAFEVEGGST